MTRTRGAPLTPPWIWITAVTLVCAAVFGLSQRTRAQRAAGLAPALAGDRGRAVFAAHCVECHGASGKGDGPAALTLTPRPRNFTSGRYKFHSTETGSLPTDDDLLHSVRRGLPGTSMPGWETLLADADIRAVVQFIKTLSPRFASEQPDPVVLAAPTPSSAESLERGAGVYATLQCGKCHGDDGGGTGATATSFEDDWGNPVQATDLTEPWTFRGGSDAADIVMRFRAGIAGTPMPSYRGTATDQNMWDLANYVQSLRRKPVWEMNAEEVKAFYEQRDAAARADPVARGARLVVTLGCTVCHSPFDEDKRMLPGMRLAGGVRMELAPFGTYPTGNLTSDTQTGLGNWTDDEIKRAITKGVLRDGTRLIPFPMDWASYSTLSAADVDALVAYLRTVPPVYNKVPRPRRALVPLQLIGKFRMLVLGDDLPSYFYAGNVGTPAGASR